MMALVALTARGRDGLSFVGQVVENLNGLTRPLAQTDETFSTLREAMQAAETLRNGIAAARRRKKGSR